MGLGGQGDRPTCPPSGLALIATLIDRLPSWLSLSVWWWWPHCYDREDWPTGITIWPTGMQVAGTNLWWGNTGPVRLAGKTADADADLL